MLDLDERKIPFRCGECGIPLWTEGICSSCQKKEDDYQAKKEAREIERLNKGKEILTLIPLYDDKKTIENLVLLKIISKFDMSKIESLFSYVLPEHYKLPLKPSQCYYKKTTEGDILIYTLKTLVNNTYFVTSLTYENLLGIKENDILAYHSANRYEVQVVQKTTINDQENILIQGIYILKNGNLGKKQIKVIYNPAVGNEEIVVKQQ